MARLAEKRAAAEAEKTTDIAEKTAAAAGEKTTEVADADAATDISIISDGKDTGRLVLILYRLLSLSILSLARYRLCTYVKNINDKVIMVGNAIQGHLQESQAVR